MHDSGKRSEFETGAVRDAADDKPRYDLISPIMMERLAHWLRIGAKKYSERNWEKGIPLMRSIASLQRHLYQYIGGDGSEDHLAAICCNAMFLIHTDEMIDRGILPITLEDRPDYSDQNKMVYGKLPPFLDESNPVKFSNEKYHGMGIRTTWPVKDTGKDKRIPPGTMMYRNTDGTVSPAPPSVVTAYLSHPIRGKDGSAATQETIGENNTKAIKIAAKLRQEIPGLEIYCPAEHDQVLSILYRKKQISIENLLAADCDIVEEKDLLLIYVPDEYVSSGMRQEIDHAHCHGINVWYFKDGVSMKVIQSVVDSIRLNKNE